MHSVADIRAIEDRLGYRVVTGMEEGLGETAGWYLEHLSVTDGGEG